MRENGRVNDTAGSLRTVDNEQRDAVREARRPRCLVNMVAVCSESCSCSLQLQFVYVVSIVVELILS